MVDGNALADSICLGRVAEPCARLLGYVADPIIASYFRNQPSQLSDLFDQGLEGSFELKASAFWELTKTFHESMRALPGGVLTDDSERRKAGAVQGTSALRVRSQIFEQTRVKASGTLV